MPEYVHTDIDTSVITSSVAYGGPGGSYFRNFDQNLLVSSIQAWVQDDYLRGLVISYNNGMQLSCGTQSGNPTVEFELNDETLTTLTFYVRDLKPFGYRSGGFLFTTSTGRSCKAGATGRQFKVDVGSGKMCGAFGTSGVDVNQLAFAMVR